MGGSFVQVWRLSTPPCMPKGSEAENAEACVQGWLHSSQGLVPNENEGPLFKNYSQLKVLNPVCVPMEQALPVLVEGAQHLSVGQGGVESGTQSPDSHPGLCPLQASLHPDRGP